MSVGIRLVITKIRNHRALSVDGVAAVGLEKVIILLIKRRALLCRKHLLCCTNVNIHQSGLKKLGFNDSQLNYLVSY